MSQKLPKNNFKWAEDTSIITYLLTYLSGLTSSFLEARVRCFGSTFDITPPGYPVQGIVFV